MQHFLALGIINSNWRWLLDGQKIRKEKKPNILVYNNACRECHVLNFVAKIKPEKKCLEKQHTHVILNDEVDFFLCSKMNQKKMDTTFKSFFKNSDYSHFHKKTFINYEVERSYSGNLWIWCVTRRFNDQSWINQLSPKNSDLRENTKYSV